MKSLHAPGFRTANWKKYENKELWVADAVAKTGKRDWLWIDDQVPNVDRLQHLGLDPNRCFKVNSKGANELATSWSTDSDLPPEVRFRDRSYQYGLISIP